MAPTDLALTSKLDLYFFTEAPVNNVLNKANKQTKKLPNMKKMTGKLK